MAHLKFSNGMTDCLRSIALNSKKKKREMLEGKEIAEISWVPTNTQIAHPLTKKGVPSFKILGFMSETKESSV